MECNDVAEPVMNRKDAKWAERMNTNTETRRGLGPQPKKSCRRGAEALRSGNIILVFSASQRLCGRFFRLAARGHRTFVAGRSRSDDPLHRILRVLRATNVRFLLAARRFSGAGEHNPCLGKWIRTRRHGEFRIAAFEISDFKSAIFSLRPLRRCGSDSLGCGQGPRRASVFDLVSWRPQRLGGSTFFKITVPPLARETGC
jgi:hypothetical protein